MSEREKEAQGVIQSVMVLLCREWHPDDAAAIFAVHILMMSYAFPRRGEKMSKEAKKLGKALRNLVRCWEGVGDE